METTEAPAKAWTPGRITLAVAGGGLVIGSLMPWATVNAGIFTVSKNGIEGDGVITLVLGGVLLLVALVSSVATDRRWMPAIVVSSLACALVLWELADLWGKPVQVGIGLWLSALAAGAGGVGSLMQRVGR